MQAGFHRLFIGRMQEQEELLTRLVAAKTCQAQFVKLMGEPGIGKTWLAEKASTLAAKEEFRVYWGKAWELGGAPPYWPWGQLLETLTQGLERESLLAQLEGRAVSLQPLLPAWFEGSSSEERFNNDPHSRFALYDAVTALLGRVCSQGPLLIILDDIHAFGLSSLQLLAFVVNHCHAQRLMILATCRDVDTNTTPDADHLLFELSRRMAEMKLIGLGEPELKDWLIASGLDGADFDIQELMSRTGGNPLFIDGLLRAGQSRGHRQFMAGPLPPTIRSAIGRRLYSLAPNVRKTLEVAAVVRRDFGPRLLAQALGQPTSAILDTLHIAMIEGLLLRVDGLSKQYQFTHSLFAEVLEVELSASQRLALHRAVGEALEVLAGDDLKPYLAELARHFLVVAELEQPEKGVRYALEAGRQAYRSSDYEAAVAYFLQALEYMPPGTSVVDQAEATLSFADALLLAGRPDEARENYHQAVRLLQPTGETAALTRAALGLYRTTGYGRYAPECTELLKRLLTLWEEDGEKRLQAQILASLSMTMWMLPEHAQQREAHSARALALARQQSSVRELAFALTARFQAIWSPDTLAERTAIVRELQGLVTQIDEPALRFEIYRWTLNLEWERCDFIRADKALNKYCEVAELMRAPQPLMNATLRRATRAQMAGQFSQVYELLNELSHWGLRAGDPQTHFYVAFGAIYPQYHQGKTEELRQAIPVIQDAVKVWEEFPGPATVELSALWMAGYREQAASLYHRYKAKDFHLYRFWGVVHAWVQCAEAAILFDDAEGVTCLYKLLLPYEEHLVWSGIGLPQGVTAMYLGRLALYLGQIQEAQEHLTRAEALLLQIGDPLNLAFTRLELVRCLFSQNSMPEKRLQILEQVSALAEQMGYVVLQERCRQVEESCDTSVAMVALQPTNLLPSASTLTREGATWKVVFAGKSVQLKAVRGLAYIARLLAHPGVELHVMELAQPHRSTRADDGIEVLDAQAKEAYRQRISELREALEEAEAWNDLDRAEKMREELNALTQELAQAVGLGGRDRTKGSHQEKARISVTRAIKRAQTMIESHHTEFAHHLRNSIKTGIFCVYQPEPGQHVTLISGNGTL